jgi:hypothetical protein
MGVLKFPKLGLPQLWGPITLCADLLLIWSLKQGYSPHRKLSNGMLHTTCKQGNRGDSWLLMVKSQITNLTLGPSFGHNLCFKCPNGSWEPIFDIYVLRSFQWYKELFNLMGFDPCNCSLKIWESIGTLIHFGIHLGVGTHLGMWRFIRSHSPTLPTSWDVILRLPFWPAPLQALVLVASPRLGLRHLLSFLITFVILDLQSSSKEPQ